MSHESAPTAPDTGSNLALEPDVGFELISEVLSTGEQLDVELAAFGYQTAEQLYDDERQAATLQEKYDLAFDPEATVRGVGGTALMIAMASPEVTSQIMTEQTADAPAAQPQKEQHEETKPEQDKKPKNKKDKNEDDIKLPHAKPGAHNSSPAMTATEIGDAAKELVYITTGIPIDEE